MESSIISWWRRNRSLRTLVLAGALSSVSSFSVDVLAYAGVARAQPPAPRRNVVLVITDDHGLDAGAYGNDVIETPNLDALAADGVLFTHAFATTASCSASRSVILTGLHNHRNAQFGHEHNFHHFSSYDDVRSLPVLLAERGYRTAIVGKFHVAPEGVYRFETHLPGDQRNPVEMAENTRGFLAAAPDEPFFLYFATADPHRSARVLTGESIDEELVPDDFGNREEGYDGVTAIHYDPLEVLVPPFLPDTPAAREELAEYYQSVSRVDQGVGRLVEILKEVGAFDETLIIYMSDHGVAFPGAKTTVYEAGLRVPLIVRNPYSESRGHTNAAMVSWVDITPTILDFAQVATPIYAEENIRMPYSHEQTAEELGLHGRSFLSVLEEQEPGGWDEIYASHTFHEIQMYYPMRVVRGRKYKLIWNIAHGLPFPFASDLWASSTWQDIYRQGREARYGPRTVDAYIHRPAFELYDIEKDPNEARNLAVDPDYSDVLADLQEKLKAFQRRTSDPWILKWDYE